MLNNNFTASLNYWINELDQYNFRQLCSKSSAYSWSLGQLYMHLIEQTNYYLEQIKICVATNDNANEEASAVAAIMFLDNEFPDKIIEGPPSNKYTPQPVSKEQLMRRLITLIQEMDEAGILISESAFKGKTKHPGLDYFNAGEWFQFAEMHFRHHESQKQRIDDFLKKNKY